MTTTPQHIFEIELPRHFSQKNSLTEEIGEVFQFVILGSEGGDWVIDFTKEPPHIYQGKAPQPVCTITMEDKDFVALIQGNLNAQLAFFTGKLKINGDFGLALRLGQILVS